MHNEYLHTHIAENLRHEVIESELSLSLSLAHMNAIASMYSSSNADLDKGNVHMRKSFLQAMSNIPYMTGGRTADDLVQADRMAAVERYKKMQLEDKHANLSPKSDS